MCYYYNAAGQRFELPERPLEPPDCRRDEPAEPEEEEYDRGENELRGVRRRAAWRKAE